mmetsp:Transcript_25602/g.56458  ORF Transcript_25602/g.56458 Transcript_25602/m.56458 type:complete len:86 (-) Transcript_25602:8-265(-)
MADALGEHGQLPRSVRKHGHCGGFRCPEEARGRGKIDFFSSSSSWFERSSVLFPSCFVNSELELVGRGLLMEIFVVPAGEASACA